MVYEERRTVDRVEPARATADGGLAERRVVTTRPSGATIASRVVVVGFGLVQILIGARILLLALDAREGNAIVAGILALSQPFVDPFEGILGSDALAAGGAVLDLAAVIALVAWTALEVLVLGILRIGRPGERL